jgi:hypothetical protein
LQIIVVFFFVVVVGESDIVVVAIVVAIVIPWTKRRASIDGGEEVLLSLELQLGHIVSPTASTMTRPHQRESEKRQSTS